MQPVRKWECWTFCGTNFSCWGVRSKSVIVQLCTDRQRRYDWLTANERMWPIRWGDVRGEERVTSLKVRIHGAILHIARSGWIASCIHPKICCAQHCTSRISSYLCNIARNKFLRVSTICSISCNSVTQISVFSQSNLTFKFNRWRRGGKFFNWLLQR